MYARWLSRDSTNQSILATIALAANRENKRDKICIALSMLHILALSVSTLIATVYIESILVTGFICSLTGMASGIASFSVRRFQMGTISLSTIGIAIVLVILESSLLHLGPQRAALPFSIVFLANQIITNFVLIRGMHQLASRGDTHSTTFTIRSLLFVMTSVAIACAVAKTLPSGEAPMILAAILCSVTVAALAAMTKRWMRKGESLQTSE